MDNKIFELPINELIRYLKTEVDLEQLVENKQTLLNQPIHIFNIVFLNLPSHIRVKIFNDIDYLKRIIKLPKNKLGKTFFDFLNENEKIEFLKQKNLLNQIDPNIIINYIGKLDYKTLDKISNIIIFTKEEQNKLLDGLKNKYNLKQNQLVEIETQLQQKNRNIFKYYNTTNKDELFLYHKFNIIVKTKEYEDDNNICLDNFCILSKTYLQKINAKHVKILLDELQRKTTGKINYSNLLIAGLRLYEIFGFDNAKKIINDKFTFMNIAALKKFAEIDYIDERRKYRLENQEKFYSYEMLKNTKKAIKEKNLHFFINICKDDDPEYLKQFYKKIKAEINDNSQDHTIIGIIQKEIKDREDIYKEKYIETYSVSKIETRESLNYEEIFNLLKNAIVTPILNERGVIIPNPELIKFLLGNEKQNNDCLFRLILNKKAFGLNENLDNLINSFEDIKKITKRKTNTLSLYSVLDVIDVCKSVSYNLLPNEQDMTLETVTKLLNSHQFCSEPKEKILKRAKKLHVARRKKYQSSIPSVSGKTEDNIKYKVLDFNSDTLITCGIDTGSCLRVGGKGEDFLNYCMTGEHAVIVGLWDSEGKFYICPFIRNGNGIYGNGLDPKPEKQKTNQDLMKALRICVKEICDKSKFEEQIEFGTITDLNQEEFLKNSRLDKIKINDYLPIEGKFYSDYHKDDRDTYIIYKSDSFKEQKLYIPKERYLQERKQNYVYDSNFENDKERIELLVNAIRYEQKNWAIDHPKRQKYRNRRRFKKIEVENFDYIVGNKDWFIAVDKWKGIESCCVPYDPRASIEYQEAFSSLEQIYNIHLGGKEL